MPPHRVCLPNLAAASLSVHCHLSSLSMRKSGEHDMTSNIIHCVLARLPGMLPKIEFAALAFPGRCKRPDSDPSGRRRAGGHQGHLPLPRSQAERR